MKRKLGIIDECTRNENSWENLKLIKESGFDCFFSCAYDDERLEKITKTAKELGLEFEFIHSPWKGINNMWTADEDPEIYFELEKTITQAAKYGIGGIVIHVSSGYHPPEICDKGLDRYDRLVALATSLGVKIAFENLRKVGNLVYMLERYEDNPNVVFCFDTGHASCYTEKTIPWLDLFGKRTAYTHFHDNMGKTGREKEDLHLLPFEGIVDFKHIMGKLNEYDYKGSIMIESLEDNSAFKGEEFIKEAYKRAVELSKM